MDVFDIKIFCEMGFKNHPPYSTADRRPSFSTIGKALGLDARTVKARVAKFEKDGFITSYQTLPNYNALGLHSTTYAFRFNDPARKKEAEQKVSSVPNISMVIAAMNTLLFSLLYKEEEELRSSIERLTELCNSDEVVRIFDTKMPFVASNLTQTDWKILKSLRNDALKSADAIASELHLTKRAINYRLQRLIENKAFFVIPMLDMRKVTNLILYTLVFFPDESENRSEVVDRIMKSFGERSYQRIVNPTGVIMFGMFAEGIGEPDENYRKATTLKGVKRVILEYTLGAYEHPAVIDAAIERCVEKASVPS